MVSFPFLRLVHVGFSVSWPETIYAITINVRASAQLQFAMTDRLKRLRRSYLDHGNG